MFIPVEVGLGTIVPLGVVVTLGAVSGLFPRGEVLPAKEQLDQREGERNATFSGGLAYKSERGSGHKKRDNITNTLQA